MPRIQFYTKPNCPLCEEVREILEHAEVDWEEINIFTDLDLQQRYGMEIPVLQDGDKVWFYKNRVKEPLGEWLEGRKG